MMAKFPHPNSPRAARTRSARAFNNGTLAAILFVAVSQAASANLLEDIGVTQLRSVDGTLTGIGTSVATVEATTYSDPNNNPGYDPQYDADNYQFNPVVVNGPGITYRGKVTTAPTTVFNPTLYSEHATFVANYLANQTDGAAPGITAIVNYNVNYFFNNVILPNNALQTPLTPGGAPPVSVVNQSFVFSGLTASSINSINQLYDNYVVNRGTIFVSGVGNGGIPESPSTAFNSIAVGAWPGLSSVGPTAGVSATYDGRSKPEITVGAGVTSYATPFVSGIASILVQAGSQDRGGVGTASIAVDNRTIKALLLNGATKPSDWTRASQSQPLDFRWGAGVANAYNSYQNLVAGRKLPNVTNNSATPTSGVNRGPAGWDLATISTTGVNHYFIDISGANSVSTLTSTLVWNRPAGAVTYDINGNPTSITIRTINDLNLKLYNFDTAALVDQSISTVDNVEHLFTTLAPGRYDLQVSKPAAGTSASETYALAWNLTGGAITIFVASTHDLHGMSQTVGGITGTGIINNSVAASPATLTVNGTSTFSGSIQNGAGVVALVKSTGGTLTLNNGSTYTGGTTITGGTLIANNNTGSATGSGAVTLNGGTLGGGGTISGAVIAGSAAHTIAPSATLAANSFKTLTLGPLTTNTNTTLSFNLVSPTKSLGQSDRILITTSNGLSVGAGTKIQIANTITGASSLGYYKIIQYSGTTPNLANFILPTAANNVVYTLESTHTAGFLELHRGFLGDANDDGTVNFSDFIVLSQNFGQSGGWDKANFDNSAVIDFNDFVTLSQHFGQTIGSGALEVTPEEIAMFQSASQSFFAGTGIPEPASLAILALAPVLLLRRRPSHV
jgi:autotransporter-associated beta strand protein